MNLTFQKKIEQFFFKYQSLFTIHDFNLEPGPFKGDAGSLNIAVYRAEIFYRIAERKTENCMTTVL